MMERQGAAIASAILLHRRQSREIAKTQFPCPIFQARSNCYVTARLLKVEA
jgi:hypothetical protein